MVSRVPRRNWLTGRRSFTRLSSEPSSRTGAIIERVPSLRSNLIRGAMSLATSASQGSRALLAPEVQHHRREFARQSELGHRFADPAAHTAIKEIFQRPGFAAAALAAPLKTSLSARLWFRLSPRVSGAPLGGLDADRSYACHS